jgi:catalase
VVLPDGRDAINALRTDSRTLEFIKDHYRHCKGDPVLGVGEQLLEVYGIERPCEATSQIRA